MKLKRKFLGVELKDSYFRQACRNIGAAEKSAESLFDTRPRNACGADLPNLRQ
jgi:hypothetical protein